MPKSSLIGLRLLGVYFVVCGSKSPNQALQRKSHGVDGFHSSLRLPRHGSSLKLEPSGPAAPSHLDLNNSMNALDTFRTVASIAQIIALVTMYLLAVKNFRMSRSSEYLQRFLSRDTLILREEIDSWLRREGSPAERLAALNSPENVHRRIQILAFANFFQELGVAYQSKLTDQKYVRKVFGFLVPHYWECFDFWIAAYREEKQRRTLFGEWEYLYNEIKKHDKSKQPRQPQGVG